MFDETNRYRRGAMARFEPHFGVGSGPAVFVNEFFSEFFAVRIKYGSIPGFNLRP
jgi:hypothetical protein